MLVSPACVRWTEVSGHSTLSCHLCDLFHRVTWAAVGRDPPWAIVCQGEMRRWPPSQALFERFPDTMRPSSTTRTGPAAVRAKRAGSQLYVWTPNPCSRHDDHGDAGEEGRGQMGASQPCVCFGEISSNDEEHEATNSARPKQASDVALQGWYTWDLRPNARVLQERVCFLCRGSKAAQEEYCFLCCGADTVLQRRDSDWVNLCRQASDHRNS